MRPMADSVGHVLAQVAKAHRIRVAAALAGLGLHVGQEMVLMQLWAQDGLTQSDLVQRLRVEPPTVTKMLQRMERAGLVERRPDPQDARVYRVYLTARGADLRTQVEASWAAVEEQMLAGLTLEEQLLLRRLLLQMRANLG